MVEKRTKAVSVKMSETDYRTLQTAAAIMWPGAVLTDSSMVLGLARLKAQEVLREPRRSDRKKGGENFKGK
jgi:hypothetical protein